MGIFYFLVHWNTANVNSTKLHNYFLEQCSGYSDGLILAVAAALALAIIYYFVLGNNVTTAKMHNWWICGIVALVATFCVSNFVLIGVQPTKKEYAKSKSLENKITYKYSFYRSMDRAVKPGKNTLIKNDMLDSEKEALVAEKKVIAQNLSKGKDIRIPYSVNTTIWCAVFYFLFSMLFKGLSKAAKTKPVKWPF